MFGMSNSLPASGSPDSHGTPLRDLGLTIQGTPLEAIVREFENEVRAREITVTPHCYLSTEWGVPFPSVSIGIPFYLAHPELLELHGQRVGHFEGVGRAALLRYLRHEMGHVVNYAWQLYDDEDWVRLFGAMTQPYLEEYHPEPFSRRFVRHLPGWYAQKHPDEDWAETFAVWMTPGDAWRDDYRGWPALEKLDYCDTLMQSLRHRPPAVTATDPDEHVADLHMSADEFYRGFEEQTGEFPDGLDGALKSIFEDLDASEGAALLPAAELIEQVRLELAADVFRWTGHFPEKTHALLRHLAARVAVLEQGYPASRQTAAVIALTTLVTALAMNHVRHDSYLP